MFGVTHGRRIFRSIRWRSTCGGLGNRAGDPNVSDVGAFRQRAATRAFFFANMKPRDRAGAFGGSGDRGTAAEMMAVPGILAFMQNPPPITVSGQFSTSVYQLTMQSADLKEIYAWAPQADGQNAANARDRGRQRRPADRQPAGDGGYRPRPRAGAGRDAAADRRTRCTAPSAAPGFGDLRAGQPVPGDPEVRPQYQRTPDALSKLYMRSSQGALVPLDTVVKMRAGGPAQHQPLRPIAGGDRFRSTCGPASRWARRPTRWTRHPRSAHAAHHLHQVPGHGEGVSEARSRG
jgi:hypothetical protein